MHNIQESLSHTGNDDNEDGAILDFSDPKSPYSWLDFLVAPPDPADNLSGILSSKIQQPADSQGASSLASVQHAPSVLAQDADTTNNDHTIAFTILKKAKITNAIITNCMIISTVMNNPRAQNLHLTCNAAISVVTNSSRVNVNLDRVKITDSIIMNSVMDDSNILNAVLHEATVNWFNMPELVIDHGTIGNPGFLEFTPGENSTLDTIQPLPATEYTSQSTRTEISCTNETEICNQSTSSQSVVEAYTTPVSDCSTPYMSAGLSLTPGRKRYAKKPSSAGRRKRRKEPQSRGGNTNTTILQLLKACNYKNKSLSEQDARDVQTVADFLIADNCRLNIQAHVKTWNGNSSAGYNSLRLPTLQNTPESAARYFEVLQSGDLPTQSLELRIAQASLYAIYLEICRDLRGHKNEDNPRRTKRDKIETVARNIILEAAAESAGKDFNTYRDQSGNFITEVLRWGKRWWSLASGVGLGVLIACSEELAVRIRDENFTTTQLNVLITYIRSARPGYLSFFGSLESATKSLMFGDESALASTFHDEEEGISKSIIPDEGEACNEDENSLFLQTISAPWTCVDMEAVSKEKAALFF